MEDRSCYNCMSYKNGDCGIAQKKICSDYEYAPEGDDNWPTHMVGPYGWSGPIFYGRPVNKKPRTIVRQTVNEKRNTNTVAKPVKEIPVKTVPPKSITPKALTPEPFKIVSEFFEEDFSEVPEKNTYLVYMDTLWVNSASSCCEVLAFYSNGEKIWDDYKKRVTPSETDPNSTRLYAISELIKQIRLSDKKVIIVCDDVSYRNEIVKDVEEYNQLIRAISKGSREKNLFLELQIIHNGNQKIHGWIQRWKEK